MCIRDSYSPGAELYHYESSTRAAVVIAQEIGLLKDRWGGVMANDPYYSHHFQQETAHHLVKSVTTGYPARR